jgi:hypothetical protein
MKSKKYLLPVLIIILILMFTTIGPAQAWASAHQAELPAHSIAAVAGGDTTFGHAFVISSQSEQEVNPAIAYNSQHQEYLVVWYNDRPGNDDIRAQRVSKNGGLVGGAFYISGGAGADRRFPDVAYNPQQDQYLVVWEHYEVASGYGIYGRRVSGAGVVLDASDIVIRATGAGLYTPLTPAVVYASNPGKYLVVWEETWHPLPIIDGIYGQVVSSTGALSGSKFTISEGSEERANPDIAYNSHANGSLVVWQQKNGSLWSVWSCLVDGDGPPPAFSPQVVTNTTESNKAPSVAAISTSPTTYKFLVVWEYQYGPTDRDIKGGLVAENGTPDLFQFAIANTTLDEYNPTVAGNELSQRYVVNWTSLVGLPLPLPAYVGIFEQSIAANGAYLGNRGWITGLFANHAAVASGPSGDSFIAFEDTVGGTSDIWGQLLGNRVYLPLVLR